jgi:hypothetical protein
VTSISRAEWRRVAALGGLLLLVVNAPYALAYLAGPQIFGGILFALADGLSYLAKMREGWRGEWLFTLPYTAEPGPGVFLFTYYLALGHLARLLGVPVEVVYHAARLLTGALFLFVAYRFIAHFFESARARLAVWAFFFLSSGLGWLAALAGGFTMDLWVAESIPFLTLLSNAHFPLAWALLLLILEWTLLDTAPLGRRWLWAALATMALANLQPMALLPAGALLASGPLWQSLRSRRFDLGDWAPALVVALAAAPWMSYQLWIAQTHPVLRLWNAQNVTPSPALPEALVWGGLPLALAAVGAMTARRGRQTLSLPLRWLLLGVALVYAPMALQRRLSIGLWLPVCLLAAFAFRDVIAPRLAGRWRTILLLTVAALAPLSNALVWASVTGAALARPPGVFLSRAEADALAALPAGALALAAPDTGAFIPARSDARVLYGHPFETVDAEAEKQAVTDFFTGRVDVARFLSDRKIDAIFFGPREAALGPLPALPPGWRVLFQQDDVTVWGK